MFGFVLGGQAGQVVSLLDPLDPEQAAWNTEMEALMKQYAIPFTMRPLPATEPARAAQIAKEVQAMPEPVTVIVAQTPMEDGKPTTKTQPAIAFLGAYAKVAPKSYASRPTWQLNHAASGGNDQQAGTVER
jgi:hypothetical protein